MGQNYGRHSQRKKYRPNAVKFMRLGRYICRANVHANLSNVIVKRMSNHCLHIATSSSGSEHNQIKISGRIIVACTRRLSTPDVEQLFISDFKPMNNSVIFVTAHL